MSRSAAFIVDQIVWAALIAALLFLLIRLLDEGTAQAFRPNSRFSRGLVATLGMRRDSLAQIGVLISGAGYVTLWAIAILLVLAPWGVHSNDLLGSIKSAFFGIKVGDVTISLSSVIFALLLFGVGFGIDPGGAELAGKPLSAADPDRYRPARLDRRQRRLSRRHRLGLLRHGLSRHQHGKAGPGRRRACPSASALACNPWSIISFRD